jgi:excisionase family DNA binding protein
MTVPDGMGGLLDVAGVATRLGLSVKAVRGLIARGELSAFKVANRLRVDPGDLDAYLEASRVLPVAGIAPTLTRAAPPGPGLRALVAAEERRSQ